MIALTAAAAALPATTQMEATTVFTNAAPACNSSLRDAKCPTKDCAEPNHWYSPTSAQCHPDSQWTDRYICCPMEPAPDTSAQWNVFWDDNNGGKFQYTGQDESDARAKYYSLSDDFAKALVSDSAIVLGNKDSSDRTFRGVVGHAALANVLPIPASSYPYNVPTDCGFGAEEHVYFYSDGVSAGEQYALLNSRGCATAITAADGSIIRLSRDRFDGFIERAVGWFYLCSKSGESCA
jgi:hypothetical protein